MQLNEFYAHNLLSGLLTMGAKCTKWKNANYFFPIPRDWTQCVAFKVLKFTVSLKKAVVYPETVQGSTSVFYRPAYIQWQIESH